MKTRRPIDSATAEALLWLFRDRDRSGEAGETAKTGSTARQEPGPKASPNLKSTPTRTAK